MRRAPRVPDQVVVVGALLWAAVGLSLAAAPPASGQATTFQADPAHTGFVRAGPAPPLRRAWTYRLPARSSYPVIAEGKVFVVAGKAHGRGSQVLALSARTGRRVWRHDLGRDGGGNPAYDQGRVYVAHGKPYLRAFAAADGRLLWQVGDGGFSAPVATGGVVYVSGHLSLGAYRGGDGAQLWHLIADDTDIAVAGGAVYAGISCGLLGAFSTTTGDRLWEAGGDCAGDSNDAFAVHEGRLYTRDVGLQPHEVYHAASGARAGLVQADSAPAFAGRTGVFADALLPGEHTRNAYALVARSLPDGRARWRFRGDGYLDSPPLIVGRTVYVGSGSGRLYALSLARGRKLWRTRLDRPILTSGLAAGEGLLVVPAFQRLVAYR